MTYFIPKLHECKKCKHQFNWSIHCDPIGLGHPHCPECYFKFITRNVDLGILKEPQ